MTAMRASDPLGWTAPFALAWLVWLGGMAIGFAMVDWMSGLPAQMTTVPEALVERMQAEAAAENGDRAPLARGNEASHFLFIFGRNFSVYLWLLAGLLSAGVVTFMVLLWNGVSLGQTIGFALWQGLPPTALAELLLPHGMLELGAFCIAAAVGFQGFRLVRGQLRGRQAVKALRLVPVMVFGVVALAAAAAVEAVVTADLARSAGAGLAGGRLPAGA